MSNLVLPEGASSARQPTSVRLQIVTPSPAPPDGEGWLHEIKHDGHRLIAIVDGGGRLSLISRNGYDRTEAFSAPFAPLAAAGHEMVIDGEIAVPDDRGVTHLDFLDDAISRREPGRLVYYAFDLLHIDGHDLRCCPIERRKDVLRQVLDEARCERIIYKSTTPSAMAGSSWKPCAGSGPRASSRNGAAACTAGAGPTG